uniref:Major intrinsic family protein n=1 Tax=Zygnema circumcarinatum TaxID=35869 RepID=A0A6M3SLE8_ZYGCR|nr:major intrinsic family protein [Zygnema circumcarinatum]
MAPEAKAVAVDATEKTKEVQGGRRLSQSGDSPMAGFVKMLRTPTIWKKAFAEAVGTFALTFAGCGAIVVNRLSDGAITHVGIAIVFGLMLMAMIYAVGHVSGAHLNPAVTISFTAVGRFPLKEVPSYVVAQVGGATAAAALLRAILGLEGELGATVPSGSAAQSLAMEIVLTFFLMFVITAVATDSRAEGTMAGIAIGGTVLLDAMFGG